MHNQDGIESQIELALSMSEDDLLQALGATSTGNASVQEATVLGGLLAKSSSSNQMILDQHHFSASHLIDLGEALFAKMWPKVRGMICHVYLDETKVGDKDLATYLVGLLVAALSISNALAILLVTLAIKRGLDMLCPV